MRLGVTVPLTLKNAMDCVAFGGPVQRWGKVDVAPPQGHRHNLFSLSSFERTLLIAEVNYLIGLLFIFLWGYMTEKKLPFFTFTPTFLSVPSPCTQFIHRQSSNEHNCV
jgi:hypothetical protein